MVKMEVKMVELEGRDGEWKKDSLEKQTKTTKLDKDQLILIVSIPNENL